MSTENPEGWQTWVSLTRFIAELVDNTDTDEPALQFLTAVTILRMTSVVLPALAADARAPGSVVRGLERLRVTTAEALDAMLTGDDDDIPPAFRRAFGGEL